MNMHPSASCSEFLHAQGFRDNPVRGADEYGRGNTKHPANKYGPVLLDEAGLTSREDLNQ